VEIKARAGHQLEPRLSESPESWTASGILTTWTEFGKTV